MTPKKPVIGILSYGRRDVAVDNFLYDAYYASPAFYVDAVRRAGGVPVVLPPGEAKVEDWLEVVDGFVFTGGTDIDPVHYGGDRDNPALLAVSSERDETELALLATLMAQGRTPVLFICRGMQVLNVAMGGTLFEHIADVQEVDIHRGADGGWTVQDVSVCEGSRLAALMGAEAVATYSGHHQGVRDVGAGLTVSARAADGIVEALELAEHPFFVAVQWHPEVSAATDVTQQRLFDGLVQAAVNCP